MSKFTIIPNLHELKKKKKVIHDKASSVATST